MQVSAQQAEQRGDLSWFQRRWLAVEATGHIGSWEWDVKQNKIEWSDELFRLYGLTPQSFDASYEAFLDCIHPEDRDMVNETVTSAFSKKSPFSFDHRILRPDDTIGWLHGQGQVEVDGDGDVLRMYGTSQDISLYKEAEAHFESLMEAAPDALILVDSNGAIILINRQAETMFGRRRREIIGTKIDELVPQGLQEEIESIANKSPTESRGEPKSFEFMGVGPISKQFPLEVRLRPLDWYGSPAVVAAVRDATQRKKAEEADKLAYNRLMELEHLKNLNQFKTEVISTAAHEMGTPITPLRVHVHLLKKTMDNLDSAQQESVTVIERNVDRLEELLTDFLDVARLQSGRLDLKGQFVDIAQVADEAAETYAATASQQRVTIVAASEGDTTTFADAGRVKQLLYNFISNAVKWTEPDTTVEVWTHSDGVRVRVEVKDMGPGLDPNQITKLFEPFSQVHQKTDTSPPGTGLGLFICKGIIDGQGGKIGVKTDGHGTGCTFWFELPVRDEQQWQTEVLDSA